MRRAHFSGADSVLRGNTNVPDDPIRSLDPTLVLLSAGESLCGGVQCAARQAANRGAS